MSRKKAKLSRLEKADLAAVDAAKPLSGTPPMKLVSFLSEAGDRSQIEAGIRELKLGEIRFIDADGKPIGAS